MKVLEMDGAKEFLEMLMGHMGDNQNSTSEKGLPCLEAQKAKLSELFNAPPLKRGDYVVRTKDGEVVYKLPKEGQIAAVVSVYPHSQLSHSERGHTISTGEIAVVGHDGLNIFPVDLRYYHKADTVKGRE